MQHCLLCSPAALASPKPPMIPMIQRSRAEAGESWHFKPAKSLNRLEKNPTNLVILGFGIYFFFFSNSAISNLVLWLLTLLATKYGQVNATAELLFPLCLCPWKFPGIPQIWGKGKGNFLRALQPKPGSPVQSCLPCLMGEQSWAPYLTSGYLVTKPSTSRLSRAVSLRQSSSRTANTASRFCWLLSRP